MAINCPQCGREYDVTLFQFGRTIHCTCGTRVGLEKRIGSPITSSQPRFILDAMLGGLARWLRILGYDTAFDPAIPDAELVRRGLAEGRHILTRDRGIPEEWRVSGCTVLEVDEPDGQLKEVLGRFNLEVGAKLFSRCTVCNALLESISREDARSRVPPRVIELHDNFAFCSGCDRVYWEGSHTERMRARLKAILGSGEGPLKTSSAP